MDIEHPYRIKPETSILPGMSVKVLLLADTHLGFDLPTSPRVHRRRRGHDFFANYERALAPALEGVVDLVVHGGDVFHSPRVPPSLVYQAFEALGRVADGGISVFVVPGNHERSRIPYGHLGTHARIRIFDRPRTYRVTVRGQRVALAGFPYERRDVRPSFAALLEKTGWREERADISLLCVHHCFEGATVGPADYTFRGASDVIRGRDVPRGFAAVLSGHIHRHQVLTSDLSGRPLGAPVFYPGSVERTAFAEKGEAKGFILLDVDQGGGEPGGRVLGWRFEQLPARPMIVRVVRVGGLGADALAATIRNTIHDVPSDAVLRLEIRGQVGEQARSVLAAKQLRRMAPPGINLEVVLADEPTRSFRRSRPHRDTGQCTLFESSLERA